MIANGISIELNCFINFNSFALIICMYIYIFTLSSLSILSSYIFKQLPQQGQLVVSHLFTFIKFTLLCLFQFEKKKNWGFCSLSLSLSLGVWLYLLTHFCCMCTLQVKQMLIALLCESEMKLADETIETILDKVSIFIETKSIWHRFTFVPLKKILDFTASLKSWLITQNSVVSSFFSL